jgi:hypothetical protein
VDLLDQNRDVSVTNWNQKFETYRRYVSAGQYQLVTLQTLKKLAICSEFRNVKLMYLNAVKGNCYTISTTEWLHAKKKFKLLYGICPETFCVRNTCHASGFGGLEVSMLASGTQVWPKPSDFSEQNSPQHAFLRRWSKAACLMSQHVKELSNYRGSRNFRLNWMLLLILCVFLQFIYHPTYTIYDTYQMLHVSTLAILRESL